MTNAVPERRPVVERRRTNGETGDEELVAKRCRRRDGSLPHPVRCSGSERLSSVAYGVSVTAVPIGDRETSGDRTRTGGDGVHTTPSGVSRREASQRSRIKVTPQLLNISFDSTLSAVPPDPS